MDSLFQVCVIDKLCNDGEDKNKNQSNLQSAQDKTKYQLNLIHISKKYLSEYFSQFQ